MPPILFSSIFGELTRNMQARFDAISLLNKRLYDNVIFERFLDWDVPTVGLNFEEIIGQYGITIAAATIGDQSNEPILGTEGVQTLAQKVLNHAITLPMTIQDYRKVLQLMDSRLISDEARKRQLIELMWGNAQKPIQGVLAKLDMMFLGALFNEGKFTLDNTTNPEGGVRGTIDYNQPAENIASVTTKWTEANLKTVDCFEDIQQIIDAATDKVVFEKILISPRKLSYITRAASTHKMVHGTDKASRLVQLKDLNEYMSSNGLPTFEPIRRQIRIQNGTQLTTYNPVSEKNLVFIPSGKLGVMKNAYANSELRQEPGVAYSNYGRIRVSQWGAGETQGSKGVEFTKAEVFALPVITEMNGIYTLKVED